jgi:hypothetical protein
VAKQPHSVARLQARGGNFQSARNSYSGMQINRLEEIKHVTIASD